MRKQDEKKEPATGVKKPTPEQRTGRSTQRGMAVAMPPQPAKPPGRKP